MAGIMAFSFTGCGSAKETDTKKETTAESTKVTEKTTEAAVSSDETETAEETDTTEVTESEAMKETEAAETEAVSEEETDKENPAGAEQGLTDEEKEILEMMGEDIIIVSEEEYASVVSELQFHTGEFNGKVYQFEGVFTADGDTSRISRTLVHDGEKTECGLPLAYLTKEIESGSWVRVTGIVNAGEADGETKNVLEVVAIEVLAEEGKAELEWDGAAHQH